MKISEELKKENDMREIKVIMLDIDGVLNSEKSLHRRVKMHKNKELDYAEVYYPVCPMVSYFNKIIEHTQAKIVISSTWRLFHPLEGIDYSKPTRFQLGLRDIFKKQGVLGDIIDVTPQTKLSGYRGNDIKEWLNNNKVDRYVIIDDNSDMLEEQMPFFVKTDFQDGLTEEQANKAIEILNGM